MVRIRHSGNVVSEKETKSHINSSFTWLTLSIYRPHPYRTCITLLRLSFFFFQAEDGIRDLTVTGVQTCALPISALLGVCLQPLFRRAMAGIAEHAVGDVELRPAYRGRHVHGMARQAALARLRSEERRVGKECRSRWSPYH